VQFRCDSCQTQLQIADEKVRGKRLVVRCRRCGAKITISDPALAGRSPRPPAARGSEGAGGAPDAGAQPTRPPAPATAIPGDPPVWFAMLQGKQDGPLTRADLATRANAGEIGPRTYLWKEGMESWRRARDIPELAALFPAVPAPVVESPLAVAPREVPSAAEPTSASEGDTFTQTEADVPPAEPARGREAVDATEPPLRPAEAEALLRAMEPEPARAEATALAEPDQPQREVATPAPAPMQPLAAPEAAAPEPFPVADARGGEAPARAAARPMFEAAAPSKSKAPFAIVVAAILAAVAAGAWLFFGPGKRSSEPPPPAAESQPDASAEAAPAPSSPAPAAAPRIEPPAVPAAPLTSDQVRKKLDENKAALQGCMDDALRRDPNQRVGRIHIAATIAPSGQVTAARIDKRSVDEAPLGACLKHATRKIVFPSFEGAPFDVDIPVVVTAGE
jgi:predicted Zn finger-like uncharacterized protein